MSDSGVKPASLHRTLIFFACGAIYYFTMSSGIPLQFGQLYFATENAIDSGRGVVHDRGDLVRASRRAIADMEEYVIEWSTANRRLGGVCANVGSCADHAATHAHAQKHSDTCNEVGRRFHQGSVGLAP